MRLGLGESRVGEFVQRVLAHHRLGAGTRRHALGLDADDAARSASRRHARCRSSVYVSSPRLPLTGVQRSSAELGAQPHVGANRALAAHDLARDRFGEAFDSRRLASRASTSSVASSRISAKRDMCTPDLSRGEIGDHRELGVIDARAAVDLQMHDAPHAGDAGARLSESRTSGSSDWRSVSKRRLRSRRRTLPSRQAATQVRRDLGERHGVVGTHVEMRLHDLAVEDEQVDVDRTRLEPPRASRAADRTFDLAREASRSLVHPISVAVARRR